VSSQKSAAAAPERSPAVVLYAEARGFTRMSEALDPAVVLSLVSEFFALVGAAVERHEGIAANRINDTLVAIFTGADDARNAVQAAQDIQREFVAVGESWERNYGIRAAVAMGLHCGDVVTGFMGEESDRLFILGDCVSIAERLLHRARLGEFVLSYELMQLLAETGHPVEAEELPPIEMSRREPIRIYGALLDQRLDFT